MLLADFIKRCEKDGIKPLHGDSKLRTTVGNFTLTNPVMEAMKVNPLFIDDVKAAVRRYVSGDMGDMPMTPPPKNGYYKTFLEGESEKDVRGYLHIGPEPSGAMMILFVYEEAIIVA